GVLVAMDVLGADEGVKGAVVARVTPGGPADRAGVVGVSESPAGDVVLGDVIVGIDDQEIQREADLYQALEIYRPGEEVRLRLSRPSRSGRKVQELRVKLVSLH